MDNQITDGDGNAEVRNHTVSVFNGPKPIIHLADSKIKEQDFVAEHLQALEKQDIEAHEIGIFVRTEAEIKRSISAVEQAGMSVNVLDHRMETVTGKVSIGTMHLAKGLEFKAVVIMACDDEVIPSQERIDTVTDMSDLEEVYNTERHLLYVACTRARDHLLVTSVAPTSEFLDDLIM